MSNACPVAGSLAVCTGSWSPALPLSSTDCRGFMCVPSKNCTAIAWMVAFTASSTLRTGGSE